MTVIKLTLLRAPKCPSASSVFPGTGADRLVAGWARPRRLKILCGLASWEPWRSNTVHFDLTLTRRVLHPLFANC
jgi:hypothetical protein